MIRKEEKKRLKRLRYFLKSYRRSFIIIIKLIFDKFSTCFIIIIKCFHNAMFPFSFEYPKGYSLSKGNEEIFHNSEREREKDMSHNCDVNFRRIK